MKFKLRKHISVFGIPCCQLYDENDNYVATIIGNEIDREDSFVRIRSNGVIVFGMSQNDVEVIE